MRTLIIILTIACFTSCVNEQASINDFFYPQNGKHETFFKCSDGTTTIYDYTINDSVLDVKSSKFKDTTEYLNRIYKYKLTNSKACLMNEELIVFVDSITKKNYSPPVIRFVMPLKNKQAEWTFIDEDMTNKCTSEFVEIDVNGEMRQAIKVSKTIASPDENWQEIEYYVKGIGLYKVEQSDDGNKYETWLTFTDIE